MYLRPDGKSSESLTILNTILRRNGNSGKQSFDERGFSDIQGKPRNPEAVKSAAKVKPEAKDKTKPFERRRTKPGEIRKTKPGEMTERSQFRD
jgi:hypothetical protein